MQAGRLIYLSQNEAVSMSDEWFDYADVQHFWSVWRFEALKKVLKGELSSGKKILEIGCGSGMFLRQLENDLGIVADGCDLNVAALERAAAVSGKLFVYNILDHHPSMISQYDIVMLLDVLEHIADDALFLKAAADCLRPGGVLVVAVPAHPWLFSVYDRMVGHQRRYSSTQLYRLLYHLNNIKPAISFWGFALLPLLMFRKMLLPLISEKRTVRSGFRLPFSWLNKLVLAVMRLELILPAKWLTGISMTGIVRTPAADRSR